MRGAIIGETLGNHVSPTQSPLSQRIYRICSFSIVWPLWERAFNRTWAEVGGSAMAQTRFQAMVQRLRTGGWFFLCSFHSPEQLGALSRKESSKSFQVHTLGETKGSCIIVVETAKQFSEQPPVISVHSNQEWMPKFACVIKRRLCVK